MYTNAEDVIFMILLKANEAIKKVFHKMINTMGENVKWLDVFVINNNDIILVGKGKSMFFNFDTRLCRSNIVDLPIKIEDAEEMQPEPLLENALNMILYVFGKWGKIKGLKVETQYEQLNRQINYIFSEIDIEAYLTVDNFRFYQGGIKITYEDVIQTVLDYINSDIDEQEDNINEESLKDNKTEKTKDDAQNKEDKIGLWHNIRWNSTKLKFIEEELTEQEKFTDRIGHNFYRVPYKCPICKEKLYMAVYPSGKEFKIETDNEPVYIVRAYTCNSCNLFYTPLPHTMLIEGEVFELLFEEDRKAYEDYRELLGRRAERISNYNFNEYESDYIQKHQGNKETISYSVNIKGEGFSKEHIKNSELEDFSMGKLEKYEEHNDYEVPIINNDDIEAEQIKSNNNYKQKNVGFSSNMQSKNRLEKNYKSIKEQGEEKVFEHLNDSSNFKMQNGKDLSNLYGSENKPSTADNLITSNYESYENKEPLYESQNKAKKLQRIDHNQNEKQTISKDIIKDIIKTDTTNIKIINNETINNEATNKGALNTEITNKETTNKEITGKVQGNNKSNKLEALAEQIKDGDEDLFARNINKLNLENMQELRGIISDSMNIEQTTKSIHLKLIDENIYQLRKKGLLEKADAYKGKSYIEIQRFIDMAENEELRDEDKLPLMESLRKVLALKADIELKNLMLNVPENISKKQYEQYLERMEQYKGVDKSYYKKYLEEKRDLAEKREITAYIKRANAKDRKSWYMLLNGLKEESYSDKNLKPFLEKIKEKIMEMDKMSLEEICPDPAELSFSEGISVYEKISQSDYLPELKTDILARIEKRLKKIKTDEYELLINKLEKDMSKAEKNSTRIHYYNIRSKPKADESNEEAIVQNALKAFGAELGKYEYPIMILDASKQEEGTAGFLITEDYLYYSGLFGPGKIDIDDIDEISLGTGVFQKGIYANKEDGTKTKISALIDLTKPTQFIKALNSFVEYLKEKPESREVAYLSKEKHDIKCCLRCGNRYSDGDVCPKCGEKSNK